MKIEILDLLGNQFFSKIVEANSAKNYDWLIPSDFQPGKYYVKISSKSNPKICDSSEIFEIKFNKNVNKLDFINPNDTTKAYIGEDFTVRYKSNYFSAFEMWLLKSKVPIKKISDEIIIKNVIINKFVFKIDDSILPGKDYSIVMVDKNYYYNTPGDIKYESRYFGIHEPNSVINARIKSTINHKMESNHIIIYSTSDNKIQSASVFNIEGRKLFHMDSIDNIQFKISLDKIGKGPLLIKLRINGEEVLYKLMI